jgi:alpha-L-fucosidase
MQRHGGRLEGVMNVKQVPEPVWDTVTRDFEAAMEDKIQKDPWQTDACIGNWHYDRSLLTNHSYQKPSLIIPMFVDIVSKNGNLLLNIPLPGHGEPDADSIAFVNAFADWHEVNREAIKGTRPWTVYGEGPSTRAKKLQSYQLSQLKFDHTDIRFTTKGDTLYAIALGWPPDGKIRIASLAENSPNYPRPISKIELLGYHAEIRWTRRSEGLEIQVPDVPPCKYAYSFRIVPG